MTTNQQEGKRMNNVCPSCSGKLSKPRRLSWGRVWEIHMESCPGRGLKRG